MYAVEVRDRIMIAHSLPDPFFGPAQHMHGATYLVDVAFFRHELTRHNVVVDIGPALRILNETLRRSPTRTSMRSALEGRADDDRVPVPVHFRPLAEAARTGALGEDGRGLAKIRVTLSETDLARASYEGAVGD